MTLTEFNSKYQYLADKEQFGFADVWEVIEPKEDGKYYGDCESYCLTLIDKVDGFEDLELWHCKYDGVGHCVGRLGGMWIDCGMQRVVPMLGSHYTELRKYWKFEIVCKKMFAYVIKKYLAIKGT